MKIVFFGTPEFAAETLESLVQTPDINILAVVSQPDKPVGRKKTLTAPPVKVIAEKFNLPVIQPQNKRELAEKLVNLKADFFVVIAFGMILPPEVLKMAKFGAINVHASLLPKYRGASPIQESLLHGDKETGLAIMKMDDQLDHGPVYLIKKLAIAETDNLETLTKKLSKLSADITPLALQDIKEGILSTPIPQNHAKATFCKKIEKEDGLIDWNRSAEEIKNLIRGYTPWPSAYTFINGKKLKILSAETDSTTTAPEKYEIENNELKIGTGEGRVIPKRVQLEGKNETDIKSFLNGSKNLLPL